MNGKNSTREALPAQAIAALREPRNNVAGLLSLPSRRDDAKPGEREDFRKARRLLNRLTNEKDNDA